MSLTRRLGLSDEDARFVLIDAQIRRHLTPQAGAAIVIQMLLRALDREWAQSRIGCSNRVWHARVSDARAVLRRIGVEAGPGPITGEQKRAIWAAIRGLGDQRPAG